MGEANRKLEARKAHATTIVREFERFIDAKIEFDAVCRDDQSANWQKDTGREEIDNRRADLIDILVTPPPK